ncbi:MAG: radical SAM family heme chaperone HemW [Thermodesulfobacteriota bacterium]
MTQKPPGRPVNWSMYLHVPFCKRKCPYCDFFSVTDRSLIPLYVDGVCKEIQIWSDAVSGRGHLPMHTLYLGGGTPSVLSVSQVGRILEVVYRFFDVTTGAEITMEVNPGTVDAGYLSDLRRLGINRLSIGAQSFDPAKLAFLCRIHSREQVFETLAGADRAGFSNLGIDLMYALPDETLNNWQTDLDTVAGLQLPHLSCYMLTLAPGTPFYDQYEKGGFSPCDPDRRSDFFVYTSQVLKNAGYLHYEVSNFARERKFRSVHNTHYWERGAYLGVGPSAHSFLPGVPSDADIPVPGRQPGPGKMPGVAGQTGPVRAWNTTDIRAWLDHLAAGHLPWSGHEILTPDQETMEQIMLGLRTDKGVGVNGLCQETRELMDRLAAQGLGAFFNHNGPDFSIRRFRLTRSGMIRLDSIVESLIQGVMK